MVAIASGLFLLIYVFRLPLKFRISSALISRNTKAQEWYYTTTERVADDQIKDYSVMQKISELEDERRVRNIGVSIYEPSEMEYILNNLHDVDVIQSLFSVMDNARWKKSDLLIHAKGAGKLLYERNIYLQGLIFRSPDDSLVRRMGAENHIAGLRRVSLRDGITVQELACLYVKGNHEIDEIILGCERPSEVRENLSILNSCKTLSEESAKEIELCMRGIPQSVIDPRKWRK